MPDLRFRSFPSARREHSPPAARPDGGRGRIRTSVARKERQIYSLLVLATHPPVRTGEFGQRRPLCISEVLRDTMTLSSRCRNLPPAINWEFSPDSKNFWQSWRRDLNPRPSDYKSDALPAELRQPSQTTNISLRKDNCKGSYAKFSRLPGPTPPSPGTSNHENCPKY